MKNNLLFLIALISLLAIAFGALFYQHQFNSNQENQAVEQVELQEGTQQTELDSQEVTTSDEQLDAQPTISEDDSLDTILQEIDNTTILDEEFSDI